MASRNFSLLTLNTFSGGLNYRADQFDLANSESPDLMNVSVDPRGGVSMRSGVDRRNPTALGGDVKGIWGLHTDNGTHQVLVNHGTSVSYSASTDFTDLTNITARTDGSRVYGVTFNNVAYGVSYDKPSFKWDGVNDVDLGSATDGTDLNMPQAQYIAVWNNFVWVANTYESGTGFKSRLRWSNLNDAQKWANSDYVDIDIGEYGDYITGLAAHGDRLVVYKANSTYAVFGFDSDSFQVVPVSNAVGSIPLSSPVSTPYGVFCWSAQSGVHLYNGERFTWVFDKIQPAIEEGKITFVNPPQLAWHDNKVYVSVDWTEELVTTRRVFIYDPSLGKQGAWVVTDIDAGPLLTFRPPNSTESLFAGCVTNTGSVIDLHAGHDRISDRYLGSTESHIESHFTTSWVSGKNPVVKKRWGKPRMVTLAEASLTLKIKVYKDYDNATASKEFDLVVAGREGAALWGTATWDWDGSNASAGTTDGDMVWESEASSTVTDVKRMPTLGTARAVSMRIEGPAVNASWSMNALAFTYVPRRLR